MSFEHSFEKILRAQKQKKKKKTRAMQLGDTDAGRSASGGKPPDVNHSADHASWNIREYKHNTGAVKGRGKLGGIRK